MRSHEHDHHDRDHHHDRAPDGRAPSSGAELRVKVLRLLDWIASWKI